VVAGVSNRAANPHAVVVLPQALILLGSSGWAARLWGVSPGLWEVANQFLFVRALGAPITVLLLVMQVRGDSRASARLLRQACM
jgi:hypothetical protein